MLRLETFIATDNEIVQHHDWLPTFLEMVAGTAWGCTSPARRTSTELSVVAEVTPSTASVHLHKLLSQRLITVFAQGKHRYYSLEGPNVAAVLEALSVLAGGARTAFAPNTPNRLRVARTCYDHIAGALGVALHDRVTALGWLSEPSADHS